jgi:tape measure domain-containing protein
VASTGNIRAGGAFVELFADGTKLSAGLAAAAQRVQQWGAQIARAGATLAAPLLGVANALTGAAWAAATSAVREFAGQMVTSSSDFEVARISLDALLGSAEAGGKIFDDLKRFALVTPFSFGGALEFSRRLSVVGYEAEELIPVMTKLGDVVAIATGGGTEHMQTMVMALSKMRSMSVTHARELNQVANLGIPIWKRLAEHVGVAEDKIRDAVRAGQVSGAEGAAALLSLADDSRFKDGMARVQGTFKILYSNLQDLFEQLAVEVGKPLFDGLKDGFRSVNEFLQSGTGKEWAARLREGIAAAVQGFAQVAAFVARYHAEILMAVAGTAALGAGLMAAGTAVSMIGTAAAVLAPALGLVVGHVGWLVGTGMGRLVLALRGASAAWGLFHSEGVAATGEIREAWAGVGSSVAASWAAVVESVRAGDLEHAFKVAALTLELEWVRLVDALKATWTSLGFHILKTIDAVIADPNFVAWSVAAGVAAGGAAGARVGTAFGMPVTGAVLGGAAGGATAGVGSDVLRRAPGFAGPAPAAAVNPEEARLRRMLEAMIREGPFLRELAADSKAIEAAGKEARKGRRAGDLLRMPKELAEAVESAGRSMSTMTAGAFDASRASLRFAGQDRESPEAKELKKVNKKLDDLGRTAGRVVEAD